MTAELFEDAIDVLGRAPAYTMIARALEIKPDDAGKAAVLAVPPMLDTLATFTQDPLTCRTVLKELRSVDAVGLQHPGTAVVNEFNIETGSALIDLFMGDNRGHVAGLIAREAGIRVEDADHILAVAGWAVMASIANRFGHRVRARVLEPVLHRELTELIDSGWGPWLHRARRSGATTGTDRSISGVDRTEPR